MFQAWSNKKFDPWRTKISNKDMYIPVFEFMKSTVILNLKHGWCHLLNFNNWILPIGNLANIRLINRESSQSFVLISIQIKKKNRLRIFSLLKFKLNLFSLYLGFQNLRERTISFPTWIWMKGLRLNFEAISSNCVTFSSLENVKGDKKELISLTRFKSFYTSGFLMFAWTIEKSSEMKRVIYT